MKKPILFFALGLGVFVCVGSAHAEKTKSTSAREKAAKKACALGDFQKGSDILTDLLVETDNPTYIYNQARCYQQNNRWEQAISRFQEYLRKATDISRSEREQAERLMAECQAAITKAEPPPPATVTPPPAVPPSEPIVATPPPQVETTPAPRPAKSDGKGLRTAGVICAVVGLAAIGAGVGMAYKTKQITSEEKARGGGTPAQEDERKTYVTLGWISYGVGATAMATGVILYLAGWPSSQTSQVALSPSLGADGASMTLTGRF